MYVCMSRGIPRIFDGGFHQQCIQDDADELLMFKIRFFIKSFHPDRLLYVLAGSTEH